jgi:hypothetical protein
MANLWKDEMLGKRGELFDDEEKDESRAEVER